MPGELLTTRQAAELLGVGTTSVKRWADEGTLDCVKTAGGHRRIPRSAIDTFLRVQRGGLKRQDPHGPMESWLDALIDGSKSAVQEALWAERERTGSWWQVADNLGPIITEIGVRWQLGELNIMTEHLASSRLSRALALVADHIATNNRGLGCLLVTAPGDDHTIGLSLAELCLAEAGIVTRWCGRRTPTDEVVEYIRSNQIAMVAVSASSYSTDNALLSRFVQKISATCEENQVSLLLGGSGAWPDHTGPGLRFGSFAELADWLRRGAPHSH